MDKPVDIQIILVTAGQEYKAVKSALAAVPNSPSLMAVPAGPQALQQFLSNPDIQQQLRSKRILLVGLGGSLSETHGVADGLWLEKVYRGFGVDKVPPPHLCNLTLTQMLSQRLPHLSRGTGVTCDRVITTVAGKRQLRDIYEADVVDMESAVLLQQLPDADIAILRVISDDSCHRLPDISRAIRSDGSLNLLSLGVAFLRRPIAAARFVQGSLTALNALKGMTATLCQRCAEP